MDSEESEPPPKFRRELRRDRNAAPKLDHVEVATQSELPYLSGVTLAHALIKHILFIRQQIPMPYDQLRSQIKRQEEEEKAQERSRRPSSYIRKARKLVEATDSVLDGLAKVMARSRTVGVLVSLGSTPINPKEAFILRFDANGIPLIPASTNKPVKDPSRQMIRQMVTSGLEQFDTPAFPQKMFVLVLVAAGAPSDGMDHVGMQLASEDEERAGGREGGWTPRHGFTPKLRKCKPVGVSVGPSSFCEAPFPAALAGPQTNTREEDPRSDLELMGVGEGGGLVWLQHSAFVRGLPHESGGL